MWNLWWPDHCWQVSPHPVACVLSHREMEKRIRIEKARQKLMDWDIDSIINKGEGGKCKNKWRKSSHSPAWADCPEQWIFGKLYPQFYCWTWHHMVWNISWLSLGQLSCLCPSLPASPQPAHWEQEWETEKVLTLCKCSALGKTSFFINIVWSPV